MGRVNCILFPITLNRKYHDQNAYFQHVINIIVDYSQPCIKQQLKDLTQPFREKKIELHSIIHIFMCTIYTVESRLFESR